MPKITYQCTWCGEESPLEGVQTACACGKPLEVVFDWENTPPKRSDLDSDNKTLWKYRDVLAPIDDDHIVTLGEGWTPTADGVDYDGVTIFFKDESVNPTGSFKDRGMSMAVSHARGNGISEVCLPSAGNAGVSASAYCQAAGIACHVFLPETIPTPFIDATEEYGADLRLGGRTIAQAASKMREEMKKEWFDLSTLKEPFRVEGKKTMGYEIAEQLDWRLPNVVVYPTGGGTGLIG
ncbi:MAG TPA: pyridoxal-phosphate dependent enzyme, partial [Candidatus Marinimicrobia bacterium]|nr:pyridoxal-phosphate dependent enzyme [Candidatus Neomarinimicrobiota bacterium]